MDAFRGLGRSFAERWRAKLGADRLVFVALALIGVTIFYDFLWGQVLLRFMR